MMKPIFLTLCSFFLVSNLFAQDRANLKKQIDKIIHYDTELELSETPGLVIGVKCQDSIFFFSYGHVAKNSDVVPDENTIFEIGGLTKSFTASLVSVLVAEGKMGYDQAFNTYLPAEEQNEDLPQLTIDKLLTHTSKLPTMPMEFGVKELEANNPYAHYTNQDLMNFYKEYIPVELKKTRRKIRNKDNDEDYTYSHLNYALLERGLEYSQKQSFETLLKNEILNPIGLSDTRIELSEEQQQRLATGYNTGGQATQPWTFQSFKASEGLKSTAKDLLKFAAVHTSNKEQNLSKAFEQTTLGRKKTGHSKRVEMARGWHIIKTNKKYYDMVAHTGNTNGHRAYLAFVKETDTAVVILSNSEHGLHNLGYLILQMTNNNWDKW